MTKSQEILDILFDSLKAQAERYKSLIEKLDLEHDDRKEFDKEINDIHNTLIAMSNTSIVMTQEELETLETSMKSLMNDVQSKLDDGTFKGDKGDDFKYEDFTPEQIEDLKVKGDKGEDFKFEDFTADQLESLKGVSIKDIKTTNNELIITDSENKEYNLGNYVNDYNNLVNKPIKKFSYFNEFNSSFNDGVFFDIVNGDDFPKDVPLCFFIYFYTAGDGGAIYNCYIIFDFIFVNRSSAALSIPFSHVAHAMNGRTLELSSSPTLSSCNLKMKINGESALSKFKIYCKEI